VKQLLVFFPLLLCLSVNAQFKAPIYSQWDTGYSIGMYGRYQLSSNAFSTNFVSNIYRGKTLSRPLRQKVSNKLTRNNRLGADLDYGLYVKHLPDSSKGIGWFVNIVNRTHANAKLPKDLVNLVMFGNAAFAGKTAELSKISASLLSYKQFELGILKQIATEKGTWNLGLGVSLLTGNQNFNLLIDRANLFTDADGESIEGEIGGRFRGSSVVSSQYFDANGLGFSASLHLGYVSEKFGIQLQASDIGQVSWLKNLRYTELDSSFRFEGVDINLFAANGGSISSIDLDTVVAGFATKKEGSRYTTILPANFVLEGFYALNSKKWHLYAGVQYRLAAAYIPYAYVGTNAPIGKRFFIDTRFAYGGFGSWHLGFELKKKFGKTFEVCIGTNNLEGYLLPMIGTAQSAYVGVVGYF